MNNTKHTLQSFYREFYGHNFIRHFRAPTDLKNGSGNQTIVKNTKQLYLQVYKRSGLWPCYISVYDHGLIGNLKQNDPNKMVFDRVFFDFDVHHQELQQIKKKIQDLRTKGLKNKLYQQDKLKTQLRNLILEKHIAEPAINEAKEFSINFKESFGAYPILFFSGCKGCHAYAFFKPIKDFNINQTMTWFGNTIKNNYNYKTIDLSVLKDSKSRLSRVPYSKHQYTDLNVVPFTIDDSYDQIINKSLNPVVKPFHKDDYLSKLGEHLVNIDPIITHNEKVKKTTVKTYSVYLKDVQSYTSVDDNRDYFRDLLGPPEREYPDKEYIMYCCPFPDHEDKKPSFRVHRTGYICYGCNREGNLAIKEDYLKFKKLIGDKNDRPPTP